MRTKHRRLLSGIVAVSTLLAAGVVFGAFAIAAPPAKQFTLGVSPGTASTGSNSMTVTITNSTPNGNSTIKSFKLTISGQPAGATLSNWSGGGSATFSPDGRSVAVGSLPAPIKPGEHPTYTVQLNVSGANATCRNTTLSWAAEAWTGEGLSGTQFTNLSEGTVTTGVTTTCSVAFTQQPTLTKHDAAISPAVAVRVTSGTSGVSGIGVTMSIGVNPGGGTLGGTTTQTTDANGYATFADLNIGPVAATGSGYKLRATAGDATLLSDAFAISNTDSLCGTMGHPACTAQFPDLGANVGGTVNAPQKTILIIEPNPGCSGTTIGTIAGSVTIIPTDPDLTANSPFSVSFRDTVAYPITGAYQFCKSASPSDPGQVLPFCADINNGLNPDPNGDPHGTEPCVEQTATLTGADTATLDSRVWMTPTDPIMKH
jgi:hypothetical protein